MGNYSAAHSPVSHIAISAELQLTQTSAAAVKCFTDRKSIGVIIKSIKILAMRLRFLKAIIAAVLSFIPFLNAQETTTISELKDWIGHYPSDEIGKPPVTFLRIPRIRDKLQHILSPADFALFTNTLAVESPIRIVDGYLVVSKCKPHDCPEENAVLLLDLKGTSMHAVFYGDNAEQDDLHRTRCYSDGTQLSHLTDSLLECILMMHHPITWNGERLLPTNPWIKDVKCLIRK